MSNWPPPPGDPHFGHSGLIFSGRSRGRGVIPGRGRGNSSRRTMPPASFSSEDPLPVREKSKDGDGTGALSNGTAPALSNGAVKSEKKDTETKDPDDDCKPGMKTGAKNLYAGKEDKKGRFKWQETIPDDIGDPAENDATAKWCLLVRNVKVYNDPQRVLAISSIVVQSPLLKKLLVKVLKNYPGVTASLARLEFSGKFEPIIHRWAELENAINTLDDTAEDAAETKAHATLLQDILRKEFTDLIETVRDMKSQQVMTFEYLWTLFQPGAIVYTRLDGQETAVKLQETKYGVDSNGSPVMWVIGKYVDWDGTTFGFQKINMKIPAFSGTRPINQLRAFPIEYHNDEAGLRKRLLERGAKTESLAGPNYKSYHGVAWKHDQMGGKEKYNVKGRIVLDTFGWNRFNGAHSIYLTSLNQKDCLPSGMSADGAETDEDSEGCNDDYYGDEDDSGMPYDGQFADEETVAKLAPLTAEQKLICTPTLRGYSLKSKKWLNFFVNCVQEIVWQKDAFERLVLPKNEKELILGFTESQRSHGETFDDFIEGKGRGMIILLCGPPGVGKTLTAESVAEEMRVPLYMMSAGDLGLDPRSVETKLTEILAMCTRWKAVLLLDEADVFLEQRSLHELERNKLVSIFLRVLEYFEGTLFLTTNRVNTFDPAFQSRIHISLNYQELTLESRKLVWDNFLNNSSSQEHTITASQLQSLAKMKLNGRQIKNILKIARLLASRKDEKLGHEHIVTTLDVTQHLHNEAQFADNTRGSLYH